MIEFLCFNKLCERDIHIISMVLFGFQFNLSNFTEQLLEPEQNETEMNFTLMMRKGNKQQYKNLAVPTDSELALNLRSQEKVNVYILNNCS